MSIVDELKKQRAEMVKTGQARIKQLTDEINDRQKEIDEINALIGGEAVVLEEKPKAKGRPKGFSPKKNEKTVDDLLEKVNS